MRSVLHVLWLFLTMLSCAYCATDDTFVDWWEDATLYQIFPWSFMDSNGDGVGDLNGITSRLDYLKEIGVTAAWLSPIYESPMADSGYDITNFTNIDPLFGTMEDFDAMIAKAHTIGIKIIMDFVPNHSSAECEWFQKSIRREDGYDDFYVWADGKIDPATGHRLPPSNWVSVVIGSSWAWNEVRQQYYLHQFLPDQPDFNFTNPMVHKAFRDILIFWLDRGVDSFRIDAVPFFFERQNADGTYPDQPLSGQTNDSNLFLYLDPIHVKNLPENPSLLYEWRELVDEYQRKYGGDTRTIIAEAYAPIEVLDLYVTNGTHVGSQVPMNFNFIYLINYSTAEDVELMANEWMDVMWTKYKLGNWVLGNHDNSRPATRIGERRVDIMTMIALALPGSFVTYYGDEIGMRDGPMPYNLSMYNFRDPERTPMQWDASNNAGFSKANSTWLPVNADYKTFNVRTERGVARSTLNIFKGMNKLKQTAAFKAFKKDGGFSYAALKKQIFQVVRTAVGYEEYRLLANLGNNIEYLDNLTNKTMEYVLLNSFSPHNHGDKVDLSKRIYLMPYESVILRWKA